MVSTEQGLVQTAPAATAPVLTPQVAAEPVAQVPNQEVQTSPQELAAPVPSNNIGAKVAVLLAPTAQAALEKAHIPTQDFSNASSILNFVSKPLLDQLQGPGKRYESSKEQGYVEALTKALTKIAKTTENDEATAADAIKSISYLAANLTNEDSVKVAFEALNELANPNLHSIEGHSAGQARQTTNTTTAQAELAQVINAKPAEVIKSTLSSPTSSFNGSRPAQIQTVIATALKSPNNVNGKVNMAIKTKLGPLEPNAEFGTDTKGDLEAKSKVVTAIAQGVAQSGTTDAELTSYLSTLSQKLTQRMSSL